VDFNSGDQSKIEALRNSGLDGEYKTAIIARRLNTIAKEVDIPGTETAKNNTEKYCEELEKSLLAKFDTAYTAGDREMMHHIARTLTDFNGGSSCVQSYVAQHSFFINLLKIAQNDEQAEEGETNTQTHEGLSRLYEEIRQTIETEWGVINEVFPNALSVMQNFIQRIFAQPIQNFLEAVLRQSDEDAQDLFLDSLAMCHAETARLVQDLHQFDEAVVSKTFGIPSLTAVINRCFEDLFVPYIDANRYIDSEKKWMSEQFDKHLSAYKQFLASRQRAAKRYAKQTVGMGPQSPSKDSPNFTNLFSQMATTMTSVSVEISNQLGTASPMTPSFPLNDSDSAGAPSIATAEKCIGANICSISRCVELSYDYDRADNVSTLFRLMIDTLGKEYLETALDK
jgi:hypothetical protein